MPITQLLERNAREYTNDIALVEVNPAITEVRRVTWREYELMEPNPKAPYRREITWGVFDEKANRFANVLLSRGIKKGDKVGILLMNCLEWLPIYFGVLKTGAIAVPFNFRYDADEILYCAELAEVDVIVFGFEFIGRIEEIADKISKNRLLFYVGENCPTFAEDYNEMVSNSSSVNPEIEITDEDYGAIYFSSGTTGFPKAILHKHQSLMHSAKVEQAHHGQSRDDVFLCPECKCWELKEHEYFSEITGKSYCCDACRVVAEKKYKEANWKWSEFDQNYFEDESEVTFFNCWNPEIHAYTEKSISWSSLTEMVDRGLMFLFSGEYCDALDPLTNQPYKQAA